MAIRHIVGNVANAMGDDGRGIGCGAAPNVEAARCGFRPWSLRTSTAVVARIRRALLVGTAPVARVELAGTAAATRRRCRDRSTHSHPSTTNRHRRSRPQGRTERCPGRPRARTGRLLAGDRLSGRILQRAGRRGDAGRGDAPRLHDTTRHEPLARSRTLAAAANQCGPSERPGTPGIPAIAAWPVVQRAMCRFGCPVADPRCYGRSLAGMWITVNAQQSQTLLSRLAFQVT